MYRSFTSSSKIRGWKRVWRDLLSVALLIVVAELILRIGPIQAFLAEKLDPYENLLWYDRTLPAYEEQLRHHPDYTIWLLGSSPMMTGLNPAIIQENLRQAGYEGITVQNYGFTTMLNLGVMAQVVDRWLLELDQPQYIILGVAQANFTTTGADRNRIEDSPLENLMIYPDNIDDYVARFLYTNSVLFHYSILAHNATIIPVERTRPDPLPLGGYTERSGTINCQQYLNFTRNGQIASVDLEGGLDRMDQLLDVIQARNIPVLVVNIPIARCLLDDRFRAVDYYRTAYLEPLADHLHQRGIPFFDIDAAFYELPAKDQNGFFDNGIHPNTDGADFMSSLLGHFLSG